MKGKAKEDFEKWYLTTDVYIDSMSELIEYPNSILACFYNVVPFSMQSGVLLEFFDSVGIYIEVSFNPSVYSMDEVIHYNVFEWAIMENENYHHNEYFKTREEALKEAFKKANEIYNQNKDE